ncbi:MAG: hemolysin family protein [Verrucomicrobiota bacterium]|jgi:putative hemolysin|nr:hemolysin family protein [Verrucomicrobiota bacterium]
MIALEIIGFLLCLVGTAFFAGIEMGIISINRLRLQHLVRQQVPGARTVRHFLTHPDLFLGTTLVGSNITNVMVAVLGASIGYKLGGAVGITLAGILTTLVVLIFGEYIPKSWFQAAPAPRTLPFMPLLRAAAWILRPVTLVITAILQRIIPKREKDTDAKLLVTREELLHLTGEGVQSGVLTAHESEMIHGVFELTHKTCGSLMTPRDKMVFVSSQATAEEILNSARKSEFNRLPVYDEAQKMFVGIVHIFDLLSDGHIEGKTAADYMRPPQLVAAYLPVDHLLPRMRVTRLPMFLVTNERYEVSGLITLEDVLTEITGEDETPSTPSPPARPRLSKRP